MKNHTDTKGLFGHTEIVMIKQEYIKLQGNLTFLNNNHNDHTKTIMILRIRITLMIILSPGQELRFEEYYVKLAVDDTIVILLSKLFEVRMRPH